MKLLKNKILAILFFFIICSCIFYSFIDNKIIEGNKNKDNSVLKKLGQDLVDSAANILTEDEEKNTKKFTIHELLSKKKDIINNFLKIYTEYFVRVSTSREENPDGFTDKQKLAEAIKSMDQNYNKMTYAKFKDEVIGKYCIAIATMTILDVYGIGNNNSNNSNKKKFEEIKKKAFKINKLLF